MALMHETTLVPSKYELLAGWLPTQPWSPGDATRLERVGAYRLDDPAGEVRGFGQRRFIDPGLVARRIIRFVREEDKVAAGERVGLIRFGSRVDVFLPQGTAPHVCVGQTMVAGETILARIGDSHIMGGVRR